jgi:enoyl-CoA hydratase/carnithine racemase
VTLDDCAELVCERRGPVSVVRLNRPEARNALTPALVDALGAAIVDAAHMRLAENILYKAALASDERGVARTEEGT